MADSSGDRKNPLFFRSDGSKADADKAAAERAAAARRLQESGRISAGSSSESGRVSSAPKLTESGKVAVSETPTEYRAALTRKALVLALAPVAMAVMLISQGVSYNGKFVAADPSRYPFVFGPIGMGALILCIMVVGARRHLGQRLVISRKDVFYDGGHEDRNFSCPWATLAYSPPNPGKRLVRSLLVSDGRKFAQFYDIFTPGFDKLVADMNKRKDQVTMGSGRLRMSDMGRIQM